MWHKLISLFNKREKKVFLYLILFSIFISLVETVGISSIMPFIAVANNFSLIESKYYFSYVYNFLGFNSYSHFVVVFGMLLIVFYIFRGVLNIVYRYAIAKFSRGKYNEIAYRLFESYMGISYKDFTSKDSSKISSSIINESQNLTTLLLACLSLISEFFVLVFIYIVLLFANLKMTIVLTLFLIANSAFFLKIIIKKVKVAGKNRSKFQKSFFKIINQSIGNFKIIKLRSYDKKLLTLFKNASRSFSKAHIINDTLSNVPRLFLESLGFGVIVIIVIYFVFKHNEDISSILPLLSIFILAMYRLLPSINRMTTYYNQIIFNKNSLDIIHKDLMYDVERLSNNKVELKNEILLKNISFGYLEPNLILENINISIKSNQKIAFIGESGVGKSTLVDIIMGLYRPTSGFLYIDKTLLDDSNIKSWRKHIGYIPQNIYLFNGSVADNISFGCLYDKKRTREVLSQVSMLDILDSNYDGIMTNVGEGGIKFSGGQKQRIAIARAIYHNPEVLVLDEATSSLDTKTEEKIMDEIYKISKNKVLIIIAHRLSTIKGCDKVYKVEGKKIYEVK